MNLLVAEKFWPYDPLLQTNSFEFETARIENENLNSQTDL